MKRAVVAKVAAGSVTFLIKIQKLFNKYSTDIHPKFRRDDKNISHFPISQKY